jgi:hypothetical protein
MTLLLVLLGVVVGITIGLFFGVRNFFSIVIAYFWIKSLFSK